jgi:hypothetical protein
MSDNTFENPLPGVPIVESPFFDTLLNEENVDAETARIARELRENGYATFDFPDADLEARIDQIMNDLRPRYDWDHWRVKGWANNDGLRIQDAWQFNENVRAIAANEKVLALLSTLYGRQAFPFQTLNFPVGTQQALHSDSAHFSSSPERFMCGVWLAFEDMDGDNGPLEYVPGSHKLPIYVNEHVGACSAEQDNPTDHYQRFLDLWEGLVRTHRLEREVFRAHKGQALIWAANLLHGGSRHKAPDRTRWSQVTHYYFEDCVYYTPLMSDPLYGKVFYRDIIDVRTSQKVPNTYVRYPVPEQVITATNPRSSNPPKQYDGPLPARFNAESYLQANPDVASAGVDPVEHYRAFGRSEGRKLRLPTRSRPSRKNLDTQKRGFNG